MRKPHHGQQRLVKHIQWCCWLWAIPLRNRWCMRLHQGVTLWCGCASWWSINDELHCWPWSAYDYWLSGGWWFDYNVVNQVTMKQQRLYSESYRNVGTEMMLCLAAVAQSIARVHTWWHSTADSRLVSSITLVSIFQLTTCIHPIWSSLDPSRQQLYQHTKSSICDKRKFDSSQHWGWDLKWEGSICWCAWKWFKH